MKYESKRLSYKRKMVCSLCAVGKNSFEVFYRVRNLNRKRKDAIEMVSSK